MQARMQLDLINGGLHRDIHFRHSTFEPSSAQVKTQGLCIASTMRMQ